MKLIKAIENINLPGGIIKSPGEIFMCKLKFAQKLIESGSANELNVSENTPIERLSDETSGSEALSVEADKDAQNDNEDESLGSEADKDAQIEDDDDLKNFTVKELKEFALANSIDIPSTVTKKDEILSLIEGVLDGEKII